MTKTKIKKAILLALFIAFTICVLAIAFCLYTSLKTTVTSEDYIVNNKTICQYSENELSATLKAHDLIFWIYRNDMLCYTKTVTNSSTFETDIYFNIGDVLSISCSYEVTSNYGIDENITITEDFFPKDEYQIIATTDSGTTFCFNFKIVRQIPQIIIDGTNYDNGTTLYFNSDKSISWFYDTIISNPKTSGINIKSSGNKIINENILFSSITKSYYLTTDTGTETIYNIAMRDVADNESKYTVVIDKRPPNAKIISNGREIPNNRYTNKPAHVEFFEYGVTAEYSINGNDYLPYSSGHLFTEDALYRFLVIDRVGNVATLTVTIDTDPPIGQLYADYAPVESGAITNGKIYLSWEGELTVFVNGKPYVKNTALTDDMVYNFVLRDLAGNSTTYRITIDTVCPSYNLNEINGDKSYLISKWYAFNIDNKRYSFATREEALSFAASKEFAANVTVLQLNNISDFTQHHLVASNGNPDNTADEVRTGMYWLYKSKANPNSLLYYFDKKLLDEVVAFYAKENVSSVNYYILDGKNDYGTSSGSMSDNIFTAYDGTLAPVANNFVFKLADSAEIYAELMGSGQRVKVSFGTPFGEQFSVNGLYRITEIDEANNETVYYVYLDLIAPELNVTATIFGNAEPTELIINKDSLTGIAAYYFESFDIKAILDADKWAVLTVTFNGRINYYTYGDTLPILNIGGEYALTLYDRLGNSYGFTVYIVGNPAEIAFENNNDDTAFDLSISLEQSFDTVVTLEIRRNGITLDYVSTDKLHYTFDRAGIYTVTLRDNFGRVIEREYIFIKSLPVGTLMGTETGGKTKTDVTFTYENAKYYAIVSKDGSVILTDNSGEILIAANDFSSGNYIVKLINLTDEENYREYDFAINTLAPEAVLSGVTNGSTTNGDVTVTWTAEDIVDATYSLNGGETLSFTSGQVLSSEGEYVIVITNDLGTTTVFIFTIDKTLDYTITVGEQVVSSVDATSQAVAVFNNEPLKISTTLNGNPFDYSFGIILTEEGVYTFRVTDDYGNATTFTITIDMSVSYSANVADGLISNGGVSFNNDEKLTVTVMRDGKVVDYKFGQTLDGEGAYTVNLKDIHGNEKTIAFIIISGVKQTFDYTLGSDVTVLSVTRNGEIIAHTGNRLNFIDDGIYIITAEVNGETYTFTLTLDATAPTANLNGVTDGGAADGKVTISEPSEDASIEIYFNGELIDYKFGQELYEYGDYKVVITDLAGNQTEYNFTLKKMLNGGAIAFIVILIIVLLGAAVTVIILRKKGKFGNSKSKKKGTVEPDETASE